MANLDKAHYIAVTGIIRNSDGKYLICKRSDEEKAFPGKWCVPGGRLERKDFDLIAKDLENYWINVLEKVLEREIKEETGLEIERVRYVCNAGFIHPEGISVIIMSLCAEHKGGEVKLNDELVDHAWVSLEEAKEYDLINSIYEQIAKVDSFY